MPPHFHVEISPTGFDSLRRIRDRKVLGELGKAIDGLLKDPGTQGKALVHPLEGIRSLRAVRNRYRILFRVGERGRKVSVLLVGERNPGEGTDIYAAAQRLLKALMG